MFMHPYEKAATDLAGKEARREYQRQWRARNPDKVRAANQRYWDKKGREYLQNLANSCEKGRGE